MPNLFAACRMDGELLVKRVSLNAAVQQAVIDLFEAQERDFREVSLLRCRSLATGIQMQKDI